MTQNTDCRRSFCPINFVLEIFGDKWSLLIVRDLMFKGKRTYGEFLASDEKIATNILADRLKRLESKGIIQKVTDPHQPTKGGYGLTQMGKDLLPIMLEITAWSSKYDPLTNTPTWFVNNPEAGKTRLSEMILAQWQSEP